MSVGRVTLRLIGVDPLVMHSSRLADPLDPITKAIAAVTAKRAKTEADHARIAELEWHGSIYLHQGAPCIPPANIKRACVDGAKRRRKGKLVKAAVRVDGPARLQFDGPTSVSELWEDERFRYRAMVRVRDALTVRTRPIFADWRATITATYLKGLVNGEEVIEFFRLAGPFGLGDGRPEFGRFLIEEARLE
jgi:hypothetical protein